MRVRYNYTERARSFFSKPKWRDTSYTVNRTEKYYANSRAAAKAEGKAKAERKAKAAAVRAQAEQKRAAERAENSQASWWDRNKSTVGTWLGAISMASGIISVLPIPGVNAAATAISLATGVASAVIDCSDGFDASCIVGGLGATVGFGGLLARGVSKTLQYIPKDEIWNADVTATAGATLLGAAGFAGNAVNSRSPVPWW